jgi:predicted dehydrogenase
MIGVGTIGAGAWGSNWVRTLAGMPEVQLRGVCDVMPASLEKIHRQYPHIRTTTRIDELLEDPYLSAIVVASIAPTHFEVASKALLAGKHVLVEKPMTLTSADAVALNRLAQERGRVLMVGHLLEYHPAILHIRELIDSGEIGRVQYVYSQRLNLGTVRSNENAWWSLAPHDVSVACRLLGGRPISVQCRGQSVLQPGIADVVFAQIEFDGGKLAHMHVSWLDAHKTRKLCVVGSKKMVDFDDVASDGKVVIYDKGVEVQRSADGTVEKISTRSDGVMIPRLETAEPLVREAKHFVECVQQSRQPLSDGESGAMVVSVLECGQRSMDQGGVVVPIPEANAENRLAA